MSLTIDASQAGMSPLQKISTDFETINDFDINSHCVGLSKSSITLVRLRRSLQARGPTDQAQRVFYPTIPFPSNLVQCKS